MKNRAFARLLQQLKGLTPSQKGKLESTLHQEGAMDIVSAVIEEPQQCPQCTSDKYQKWGVRSGLQRYRCNRCKRTYNALTGTPPARLRHNEVWADFAKDLMKSATVRESAADCGVHKNTAFRWRHRMLNNAKRLDRHLHGIVAFDETYFLESRKGERNLDRNPRKRGGKAAKRGISSGQTAVLVARDRTAMDAVLFKSNQDTLAEVMLRAVDNDALLCSDKKPSYRAFARKHHRILKTINAAKEPVSKGKSILSKTSMPMTAGSNAGCSTFTGWQRSTLKAILDGCVCLTGKKTLRPSACWAFWPDGVWFAHL